MFDIGFEDFKDKMETAQKHMDERKIKLELPESEFNMYDEEWENFRAEAHAFVKNKEESVIKKWLNEIGYTEPVGYYRSICNREVEIYATRPGLLIGKAGIDVKKFEKMLSEEFSGEWKVKFIEVRGGFVQI